MGQESKRSLTGSSAQGLTRLQSVVQGRGLIWGSNGEGSGSKLIWLLAVAFY